MSHPKTHLRDHPKPTNNPTGYPGGARDRASLRRGVLTSRVLDLANLMVLRLVYVR